MEPNERLLQDVATVKARSGVEARVSKPQWQNIVDELTGVIFPAFFKSKDEIVEATCEKMVKLEKAAGKPILYLRQDNAGENKALERRMASSHWKRTTKVEYTARSTPQQNSLAENSFTTLSGRARATMNAARVPIEQRFKLFPEVVVTVAKNSLAGRD